MSCLINSGYVKPCDTSAGIAELKVVNYDDVDTITISSGEATAVALNTNKTAYLFKIEKESATFTDKAIGSVENGSYAREQTAEIRLHGNQKEHVVLMELLGRGRVVVFAKYTNGTSEVYFHEKGAKFIDERQSGRAFDDFNGHVLTTTHRQLTKAPVLASGVYEGIPVP